MSYASWYEDKRKYTRFVPVANAGNQLGYEEFFVGNTAYRIPVYTDAQETEVGAARRTYSISPDSQALTSGAWVDITFDDGVGSDISSFVTHVDGTSDFTLAAGSYSVFLQYSFAGLAGTVRQIQVQFYNDTDSVHFGHEVDADPVSTTAFGTMAPKLSLATAKTFKVRLNCTSTGTPTTGVAADFFLVINQD